MLLALVLTAQKKTNYEKYWQAREDSITRCRMIDTTEKQVSEFDDLYYQPVKRLNHRRMTSNVIDTLITQNPQINITYDPFFYSNNINRFYHGGFSYWTYTNPWYYTNYWMYDNYDWYWEFRFMRNSYWYNTPRYHNGFSFGYDNYQHNNWKHNNPYRHNGNGFQQRPEYSRNERPSTQLTNHNNRIERRVVPQDKSTYQQQNRRSYTPSYDAPRLSTRPSFNNTKPNDMRRNYEKREIRTYQPQSNRNNTPSRNYSPPPQNRNSQSQGFGRTVNFDTGADRRSSGGSNNSTGSNNSSSGRSSGASNATSGRR